MLVYSMFATARGQEAAVRTRFQSNDVVRYTLTGEDVKQWPNFPLQAVAQKFFGDPDLWPVLMDANALKAPWAWAQGDPVVVPRDYQDAIRNTAEVGHLLR